MESRRTRLPVTLSGEEQAALLEQPNPRYPTGARNLLLIRLLLDTCIRLAEAAALKWNHVDLATGRIMVIEGKGSKAQRIARCGYPMNCFSSFGTGEKGNPSRAI
jgi:integrase/recombinase XerD